MVSYYIDNVTDPTLPRLFARSTRASRSRLRSASRTCSSRTTSSTASTTRRTRRTCRLATAPNQIRKVNLFLAARSLDKSTSLNDYFRNSMATEIGLRSLSYVDRYQ